MLTSVHHRYLASLVAHGISDTSYAAQKLEEKSLNHFQGVLQMGKQSERGENIFYCDIYVKDTIDVLFQGAMSMNA